MIIDGHIHIRIGPVNPQALLGRMTEAHIDAAVLISLAPVSYPSGKLNSPTCETAAKRLDHLFAWTQDAPNLYPVFWIDPLEPDALEQVQMAVERGVVGFKVICTYFYPQDDRAMPVYQKIADANKPITFHSGIHGGPEVSGRYNQPINFEAMLDIKGLKFCLAHISWPWCDECIALYGKFRGVTSAHPDITAEMFIDITPGTPRIYRRDALAKLLTIDCDIKHNIIHGSDGITDDYNDNGSVQKWLDFDEKIYQGLNLPQQVKDDLLGNNLKRFIGIS